MRQHRTKLSRQRDQRKRKERKEKHHTNTHRNSVEKFNQTTILRWHIVGYKQFSCNLLAKVLRSTEAQCISKIVGVKNSWRIRFNVTVCCLLPAKFATQLIDMWIEIHKSRHHMQFSMQINFRTVQIFNSGRCFKQLELLRTIIVTSPCVATTYDRAIAVLAHKCFISFPSIYVRVCIDRGFLVIKLHDISIRNPKNYW